MKIIELTDEEYYFLKAVFERVTRQLERKPTKRKWVKHDGLMINIETGRAFDIATNKSVIDVTPEVLAMAIEKNMDNDSCDNALIEKVMVAEYESNLRAQSGSDINIII